MAAPAGMTAGYLLSTAIMEMIHDKDLHECAAKMVKRHQENKHISSCESAALNWESKLFVDLGPDLVTLLGSGWLSQTILSRAALWIRVSKLGERFLVSAASRLGWVAGPVSGIISIMGFLVLNEVIDRYGTKGVKEWRFENKVKSGMTYIQDQLTGEQDQFTVGQSQFTEKTLKSDLDKVQDNLKALRGMNPENSDYDNLRKENAGIIQNLQERWKTLIQKVKELDFNFERWVDVKGLRYLQSFQSWRTQTEKLIYSFQLSATLLREIYALSHSSQIGPQNKYLNELTRKRENELEVLTREYTNITIVPEAVFKVCDLPLTTPTMSAEETIKTRINNLSLEYKNDKGEGQG